MMGEMEVSRRRRGKNNNLILVGSIKEVMAVNLQNLSRAITNRTFWRQLIHIVAIR